MAHSFRMLSHRTAAIYILLFAWSLSSVTVMAACSGGAASRSETAMSTGEASDAAANETATAGVPRTQFTYVQPRVTRGELAEFILLAPPNARCDITVTYAGGPPNLDAPPPATVDREGNLRFTWTVNRTAPVGGASAVVRCADETVSAHFTVV